MTILEEPHFDVYTFWPRMIAREYIHWATIRSKAHAIGFKDMMLKGLPQGKHGFGVSVVEKGGEAWDGEHFTNGDTV